MSKFQWDEAPETSVPESVKHTARLLSDATKPDEINITEVLTVPTDALNTNSELLNKLSQEEETKIDKPLASTESLRNMVYYLQEQGAVSRENHNTLMKIEPTLKLSTENHYTRTPSFQQFDNTIEVTQKQISHNLNQVISDQLSLGEEYFTKIVLGTKEDNKTTTDILNLTNQEIQQIQKTHNILSVLPHQLQNVTSQFNQRIVTDYRRDVKNAKLAQHDEETFYALNERFNELCQRFKVEQNISNKEPYPPLMNSFLGNPMRLLRFVLTTFKTQDGKDFVQMVSEHNQQNPTQQLRPLVFLSHFLSGDYYRFGISIAVGCDQEHFHSHDDVFTSLLDKTSTSITNAFNAALLYAKEPTPENKTLIDRSIMDLTHYTERYIVSSRSIDSVKGLNDYSAYLSERNGLSTGDFDILEGLFNPDNFDRFKNLSLLNSLEVVKLAKSIGLYTKWYQQTLVKSMEQVTQDSLTDEQREYFNFISHQTNTIIGLLKNQFIGTAIVYSRSREYRAIVLQELKWLLNTLGSLNTLAVDTRMSDELLSTVKAFNQICLNHAKVI